MVNLTLNHPSNQTCGVLYIIPDWALKTIKKTKKKLDWEWFIAGLTPIVPQNMWRKAGSIHLF
jgi:hypothetical protein